MVYFGETNKIMMVLYVGMLVIFLYGVMFFEVLFR
jgi:hypothetical protein